MEATGWEWPKPYGEVLDEMAAAGYEGTELGPYGYLPAEPERLRAELSARGLELVSAFVPVPLAEPERHEAAFQEALRVAELLARSGAGLIVLADEMTGACIETAGRVVGARDRLTGRQWDAAIRMLERTARACRELGLSVAFHHHAGTFIETPDEIERLCASTDPKLIGLCLDTGHYFYGGGDPVDAARRYGARIRHLHLKDVDPTVLEKVRREGVGFLDAVRQSIFCELGQGAVNFTAVIGALADRRYSGWAVVEQDLDASQPGVRPLECAIRSRRYLRDIIGI